MMTHRPTYEILRDTIMPAMAKTISAKPGTAWIDNLDGTFTLRVCSTLWVYPGMTVTIDGVDYVVKSVVNNTSLTIEAASAPLVVSFDLVLPFFWHGTIRFTNDELTRENDDSDKFPMIFLHEPTNERHDRNRISPVGMKSDCELYFMKPSDWGNWTNENHYDLACAPMRNMCMAFIEALESLSMKPFPEAEIEDRVKWGQAVINGNLVDLISGELSGTSLKISPQFEKKLCCCNC